MCHVLWYGDEEHPDYVCYLVEQESAESFAARVAKETQLIIHVKPMHVREARWLGIPYVEEVYRVFTRSVQSDAG